MAGLFRPGGEVTASATSPSGGAPRRRARSTTPAHLVDIRIDVPYFGFCNSSNRTGEPPQLSRSYYDIHANRWPRARCRRRTPSTGRASLRRSARRVPRRSVTIRLTHTDEGRLDELGSMETGEGEDDNYRLRLLLHCGGMEHSPNRTNARPSAYGPLPPSVKVLACSGNPACVRVEHLHRDPPDPGQRGAGATGPRGRARRGSGSLQRVRPGVWKLTARTPPGATGRTQRVHRNISAQNEREATDELERFVAEVRSAPVMAPADQQTRMDDALERFLSEYLDPVPMFLTGLHHGGRQDPQAENEHLLLVAALRRSPHPLP